MGLAANLAGPGKIRLARDPAEEYGAWGVLGCSNPMTSERHVAATISNSRYFYERSRESARLVRGAPA